MPRKKRVTRRAALGLMAGGGLLAATETLGFSNVTANRGVNVETAADPDALVGLDVNGTVQKNKQERLVTVTNNTSEDGLGVTVGLTAADSGKGDLSNTDFTIDSGQSGTTEITASDTGTIDFRVEASANGFSFSAVRSTDAQAGNTKPQVVIKKVQGFSANLGSNDWTVDQVQVKDEAKNANRNLDQVEYVVTDGNEPDGNQTVGERTDAASGQQYQEQNITIEPNGGSVVEPLTTYTLTVTATDADGNSDTATREDTADSTGGGPPGGGGPPFG